MTVSPNATQSQQNNNTPGQQTPGEIDLAQSKYDFRYLAFPSDLGMENMGHYMVININVQTNRDDSVAGKFNTNQWSQVVEPLQRSKVDQLRFGATPSNGGPAPENRPWIALNRSTRRIQESIALHMPTPIVFNDHNIYEEISLTALGARLGVAAASMVTGARSLRGGALGVINSVTNNIGDVAQVLGTPINPMVEVLFANKVVRQFTFEVLMAPRNEYESETVKAIIKTLRFHSAPEISGGLNLGFANVGEGLLWIPPAEFDITFFNKGVENMNILRVNTCALERVEVDYAPAGVYSTFRNGHPVAVRMSLAFRELEPIHKLRVAQGF
jgi:hypothetical protein